MVFAVVTNLFFITLTGNWLLIILGTIGLVAALVLLNHFAPKFSVVVSMSWLGAQTMLMAIVFFMFDITDFYQYISELRHGHFAKVG